MKITRTSSIDLNKVKHNCATRPQLRICRYIYSMHSCIRIYMCVTVIDHKREKEREREGRKGIVQDSWFKLHLWPLPSCRDKELKGLVVQ